jgi:hypothetical protein
MEQMMIPKHDEDFYGWAMAEASLLRQRKWNELDIEHLAEELESMGASEKRELVNRMAQLIFHLLKWQLQPDYREFNKRSWEGSIIGQRKQISRLIRDNPSLKSILSQSLADSYEDSQVFIRKETPIDLKLLPTECPYTFEQMMNDEFYPE